MSLLTIIQNACDVIGIPRPNAVIGSTDTQVRQLLAIANNEGKALAREFSWQALTKEETFTTVAAELQGDLADIADDVNWQLTGTYWNRTKAVRTLGAVSPQTWQARKALLVNGIYSEFRIKEKKLYLIPAPPAGETIAFEYVSKNWCQSSGGTGRQAWAADSDTGVLDEYLMELGVIFRWLRQKRLSYGEEMREYAIQVELAKARDSGGNPTLSLDGCSSQYRDVGGLIIPETGFGA
jgi:hypothetical protein